MNRSIATVTFENFRVGVDSVDTIGALPETDDSPAHMGVSQEIATVYGYEGSDRGELIGVVAPNPELQKNIDLAKEKLADPQAREAIGYGDKKPIEIPRLWAARTRLQTAVFRPFMEPSDRLPAKFNFAGLPERVPGWMERMADIAIRLGAKTEIEYVGLISSDREIGPDESTDVAGGTPSAVYMEDKIAPRLRRGLFRHEYDDFPGRDLFGSVELITTGEKRGNKAMARAAAALREKGIELATAKVVMFAVAGNWPQTGAQAREAFQGVYPDFDKDPQNRQLHVMSDGFPMGITGDEPKTTHQNPYSSIGNQVRGFKLLDDQS